MKVAVLSERFDQAEAFAHHLHRRQRRKTSGMPYLAHLLSVAALVMEDGGTEDEALAALLHDSLEDQGQRYPGGTVALAAEIESRFGTDVRRMVEALTEQSTPADPPTSDKRQRWRAHKMAYFAQIGEAGPKVRRISCADSLHNVRTLIYDYRRMGERIWERFLTGNGEDQVWAYGSAAERFQAAGTGTLADELAAAVGQLAALISTTRSAS